MTPSFSLRAVSCCPRTAVVHDQREPRERHCCCRSLQQHAPHKRAIVSCLPWWHVPIPVRRDVERVLGDHFQNSIHLSGVLYVYSNGPDDDVLRLSISQDCPVDDPRCQVTVEIRAKREQDPCISEKTGTHQHVRRSVQKTTSCGKVARRKLCCVGINMFKNHVFDHECWCCMSRRTFIITSL